MFKIVRILILLIIPAMSFAQGDTALVAFRKLFKWKPLPYNASFNNKEFEMDSIWNTVEDNGYIKFRADVLKKPSTLRIPKYMQKRFIKLDTIAYLDNGDTAHAEFYAIGYVGSIKNVFCYIIERQFAATHYRSAEKYLFTYDKKCKVIDKLLLTHEIPPVVNENNFDLFSDNFYQLTWFAETKGIIYEDMDLELENEIGKVTKYKINENGKIKSKAFLQ